jgi:hypothetical protein
MLTHCYGSRKRKALPSGESTHPYFIFDMSRPFHSCYQYPSHYTGDKSTHLPVYIRTRSFNEEIAYTWLLTENQKNWLMTHARRSGKSETLNRLIRYLTRNEMQSAKKAFIRFLASEDWFYHAYDHYCDDQITLSQLISLQHWAAAITQFGSEGFTFIKIQDFFRFTYQVNNRFLQNKSYSKLDANDWAEDVMAYCLNEGLPENSPVNRLATEYLPHHTLRMRLKTDQNHYYIAPSVALWERMMYSAAVSHEYFKSSYHLSTDYDLPYEIFTGFHAMFRRPAIAYLPDCVLKSLMSLDQPSDFHFTPPEYYAHHNIVGPWGLVMHDRLHAALLNEVEYVERNVYICSVVANVCSMICQLDKELGIEEALKGKIIYHIDKIADRLHACPDSIEPMRFILEEMSAHVISVKTINDYKSSDRSALIYAKDEKCYYYFQTGFPRGALIRQNRSSKVVADLDQKTPSQYLFDLLGRASYEDLMRDGKKLTSVMSCFYSCINSNRFNRLSEIDFFFYVQIFLYKYLMHSEIDRTQWDEVAASNSKILTVHEMESLPAIRHYAQYADYYDQLLPKVNIPQIPTITRGVCPESQPKRMKLRLGIRAFDINPRFCYIM